MISKKQKGKFKPLTIILAFDKKVAQAIKIGLELIYKRSKSLNILLKNQQYFQNCSFGFKLNRSCHAALKTTITSRLVFWFITR